MTDLNTNLLDVCLDFMIYFDINSLCDKAVKKSKNFVDSEGCSLFLRDEEQDTISIRAARGLSEKLIDLPARYNINKEGITAWVAKNGNIENFKSAKEIKKHINFAGKYIDIEGITSNTLLIIPIKHGENIYGVLKLTNKIPSEKSPEKFFTHTDVSTLISFTDVIANAIKGLKKISKKKEETTENISNTLHNITDLLATEFNFEMFLDLVVEETAKLLKAEACALFIADEYSDEITITMKSAYGFAKKLLSHPEYITYTEDGQGITASILRERKLLNLRTRHDIINYEDPQTQKKIWAGQGEKEQGKLCYSYLAAPLIIKNDFVGLIRVENKQGEPFEDYFSNLDENILKIMMNSISVAVKLKGEQSLYQSLRGKKYKEIFGSRLLNSLKELEI